MNILWIGAWVAAADAADWSALAPPPMSPNNADRFILVMLFMSLLVILHLVRGFRQRIGHNDSLNDHLGITQALIQSIAMLTAFLFVGSMLPQRLILLSPWVLLAGAIGAGWSLRDVFTSFVAWIVLVTEGQIKPGVWIHHEQHTMKVLRVSPRATTTRHIDGKQSLIPNQELIQRTTTFEASPWPRIEVHVSVPDGLDAATARRWLTDIFITSPWCAPEPDIHCERVHDSTTWSVRLRVLDEHAAMAVTMQASDIIRAAKAPLDA